MLKGLLDRFRDWRGRRAWLRYLDDVEKHLFFEYASFQLKDMKRIQRRQKEKERLLKKIMNNKDRDSYIA